MNKIIQIIEQAICDRDNEICYLKAKNKELESKLLATRKEEASSCVTSAKSN